MKRQVIEYKLKIERYSNFDLRNPHDFFVFVVCINLFIFIYYHVHQKMIKACFAKSILNRKRRLKKNRKKYFNKDYNF